MHQAGLLRLQSPDYPRLAFSGCRLPGNLPQVGLLRLQAPRLPTPGWPPQAAGSQATYPRLASTGHGEDWVAVASKGTGGKDSCQKSWQDLELQPEGPSKLPALIYRILGKGPANPSHDTSGTFHSA